MKTLIINGSPRKNGDTMTLINEMRKYLEGDIKVVNTYYDNISPCTDCRACWHSGKCIINDEMQEIYKLVNEADNVIIASPLYMSELTGPLLSFYSRFQYFYVLKFIRKATNFKLKRKNGILIITGGGDGGPNPAVTTANIMFKQLNTKLLGSVFSLNTDKIPAEEDTDALNKARQFAIQLNALNYLKENERENLNIINFMESYPVNYIDKVGRSVVVKGISDRNWVYISSKDEKELEEVRRSLSDTDKCFAIIEDWMIPILTKDSKIRWKLTTMRLVLNNNIPLSEASCEISKLTVEDSKFIFENSDYKEYVSVEYINERIENGLSCCIRLENRLIAWGITQDDGAIGFLHVLPEYRGHGYSKVIMTDLISKIRNMGKIPFVHIEEENKKSMNLALGLGFERDRNVSWFEIY